MIDEVRAEGRTVFFSSHVLSEVEHLCDRVGIVREGELVAVETTESLLTKRVRHMTITFAQPVDGEAFASLAGVCDVRVDGANVSLSLTDGLDQVVKLAARHTVVDMDLPRPSLEEVFFTYYGGGAEPGGASPAGASPAAEGGRERAAVGPDPADPDGTEAQRADMGRRDGVARSHVRGPLSVVQGHPQPGSEELPRVLPQDIRHQHRNIRCRRVPEHGDVQPARAAGSARSSRS